MVTSSSSSSSSGSCLSSLTNCLNQNNAGLTKLSLIASKWNAARLHHHRHDDNNNTLDQELQDLRRAAQNNTCVETLKLVIEDSLRHCHAFYLNVVEACLALPRLKQWQLILPGQQQHHQYHHHQHHQAIFNHVLFLLARLCPHMTSPHLQKLIIEFQHSTPNIIHKQNKNCNPGSTTSAFSAPVLPTNGPTTTPLKPPPTTISIPTAPLTNISRMMKSPPTTSSSPSNANHKKATRRRKRRAPFVFSNMDLARTLEILLERIPPKTELVFIGRYDPHDDEHDDSDVKQDGMFGLRFLQELVRLMDLQNNNVQQQNSWQPSPDHHSTQALFLSTCPPQLPSFLKKVCVDFTANRHTTKITWEKNGVLQIMTAPHFLETSSALTQFLKPVPPCHIHFTATELPFRLQQQQQQQIDFQDPLVPKNVVTVEWKGFFSSIMKPLLEALAYLPTLQKVWMESKCDQDKTERLVLEKKMDNTSLQAVSHHIIPNSFSTPSVLPDNVANGCFCDLFSRKERTSTCPIGCSNSVGDKSIPTLPARLDPFFKHVLANTIGKKDVGKEVEFKGRALVHPSVSRCDANSGGPDRNLKWDPKKNGRGISAKNDWEENDSFLMIHHQSSELFCCPKRGQKRTIAALEA